MGKSVLIQFFCVFHVPLREVDGLKRSGMQSEQVTITTRKAGFALLFPVRQIIQLLTVKDECHVAHFLHWKRFGIHITMHLKDVHAGA